RYSYFWFEESDIDSQRLSAYARLVHDWRPRTRLSVNGEVTNVGYIEERHTDYNRADVFGRMEDTLARGMLQVDAGGTLIRREEGDDLDGFLGRIGWNLNLNSYSSVEAAVLYEYTDAGHDILATAGRDGGVGVLEEQVTGDLYYNRHAELAYNWHGVRTSLRVAGIVREEDHEVEDLDRTINEIHGLLGYQLSSNLRVALTGSHSEENFREVDVVLRERHAGLGIHYQLNSRLWAALEVGTTEQDSNDPTVEYTENVALISLTYERTPPFLE
ncbi:MAG: outer membrane beta-barrel protein, partial [Thiohalomonadaceae bacterium]